MKLNKFVRCTIFYLIYLLGKYSLSFTNIFISGFMMNVNKYNKKLCENINVIKLNYTIENNKFDSISSIEKNINNILQLMNKEDEYNLIGHFHGCPIITKLYLDHHHEYKIKKIILIDPIDFTNNNSINYNYNKTKINGYILRSNNNQLLLDQLYKLDRINKKNRHDKIYSHKLDKFFVHHKKSIINYDKKNQMNPLNIYFLDEYDRIQNISTSTLSRINFLLGQIIK